MSEKITEDNFLNSIKRIQREICCLQEEIDSIIAGNVDLVIDVTEVTDATNGYFLYNNNGVLGQIINPSAFTSTATSNGTVTLTSTSSPNQEFTGSTQVQTINLGDCTTYTVGKTFRIINNSTNIIRVQDNAGSIKRRMLPEETTRFTCTSIANATGAWYVETAAKIRTLTKHLHWEEDFEVNAVTDTQFTSAVNNGGGAGATATLGVTTGITAGQAGIIALETGTGTTARSSLHRGGSSTFFGGGAHVFEAYVYIPVLSVVSDEYIIYAGFGDTSGAGDMNDGVYFKYDRLTSVNWQMCTANSGAGNRTSTASSTAVTAASWIKLRIEVNATGTRADYFVNDTNIGNVTTNIPTTSARVTAEIFKIEKSAGSTNTLFNIDWVQRDFVRTTSL